MKSYEIELIQSSPERILLSKARGSPTVTMALCRMSSARGPVESKAKNHLSAADASETTPKKRPMSSKPEGSKRSPASAAKEPISHVYSESILHAIWSKRHIM